MIYQFHKDISARSDGSPLSEKLPCEVVHAFCPIVLLHLYIIDIAHIPASRLDDFIRGEERRCQTKFSKHGRTKTKVECHYCSLCPVKYSAPDECSHHL